LLWGIDKDYFLFFLTIAFVFLGDRFKFFYSFYYFYYQFPA
jgi:hypothetical protein